MPVCGKCNGTGLNRHSGFLCDFCAGEGFVNWMDLLTPWVIVLVVLGVALTLGQWLYNLIAK
jgi:hypothetical protein